MSKVTEKFQKRIFNPANKEDLAAYGKFLATNSWGQETCPFKLVWPYVNIPLQLAAQTALHAVSAVEVKARAQ